MLPAKLDGCIQAWVVFPGVVVGEREVARDWHNLGYTVRIFLLRRIVPSCTNMSMSPLYELEANVLVMQIQVPSGH